MCEAIRKLRGAPARFCPNHHDALPGLRRALFFRAGPVLLLSAALLLGGCARAERAASESRDDYAVIFAVEPAEAVVGDAAVVVTLKDLASQPVSDARLDVEANMSHAGMTPVNGQASSGADGVYRVPLKWTMAGDWYVDMKFTLADGKVVSRRFPVKVGAR